jgi:hypothetical protein
MVVDLRVVFRDLELGLISQEEFAEAVRRTFPASSPSLRSPSFSALSRSSIGMRSYETSSISLAKLPLSIGSSA